jgi:hypothetical protein
LAFGLTNSRQSRSPRNSAGIWLASIRAMHSRVIRFDSAGVSGRASASKSIGYATDSGHPSGFLSGPP